jgi:protein adenylyltransferase
MSLVREMSNVTSANIGFNFDNSYITLSQNLYRLTEPEAISNPALLILNEQLAAELGLNTSDISDDDLAALFSGQNLPEGAQTISQAYAGHQFGNFTNLGDGRAHLLGEHVTPAGQRVDIQFKGSGRTPYSRRGDGRAALGPMLREYIISEALYALGLPTTRSLAVTTTGEAVFRQTVSAGAVLTRVASSHIRVGTFQYLAADGDLKGVKQLADYVINRHYSHLEKLQNPYLELLKEVMSRQIQLVTDWMRVGFIHGVMNTDNMAISGETIDYGPCAFMDVYDPETVFSSIDVYGRYAFSNQSRMAQWNLARFAETMLPLIDEDEAKAIEQAEEIINSFGSQFEASWQTMMNAKLGLTQMQPDDKKLVENLLNWMKSVSADYTNTFADLTYETLNDNEIYQSEAFSHWYQQFKERQKSEKLSQGTSVELMKKNNPVYIPRNHQVEMALNTAENNRDISEFLELLDVVKQPYCRRSACDDYMHPPTTDQIVKYTYCGT